MNLVRSLTISSFLILASAAAGHAQVTFQGLGDLTGGAIDSRAWAVSADGSVVVGHSTSADGIQIFRWTSATGLVVLGSLPGATASDGFGVSGDGSVVVGDSGLPSPGATQAIRWSAGTGTVGLGVLALTTSWPQGYSYARGVSSDGAVVVGYSATAGGAEPFRWTAGGGMLGLGNLTGNTTGGADAISANGTVIVGYSGSEAFRWTTATGMLGLGDLAGGSFNSRARAVSADGSVIVGRGSPAHGLEAFRWTETTGMVGLGNLNGTFLNSDATGVSGDGSVIIGTGTRVGGSTEPFVWTTGTGMLQLSSYLTGQGIDLSGWTQITVQGISYDGSTIVGLATHGGNQEAFVVSGLSFGAAVPEPSTWAAFAGLGALGFAAWRKRRLKNSASR